MKTRDLSFKEGLERIDQALHASGIDPKAFRTRIVTSRDPDVVKAVAGLKVTTLQGNLTGFHKWQLPISLDGPAQMFLTVAPPGVEVERHSHDEGDGIRILVSGSIFYGDQELSAGDWMFIPRGEAYSIRIGARGAVMCYCYRCCCVPV